MTVKAKWQTNEHTVYWVIDGVTVKTEKYFMVIRSMYIFLPLKRATLFPNGKQFQNPCLTAMLL